MRKGPKPHLSEQSQPGRSIPDSQKSSLRSFTKISLSFWINIALNSHWQLRSNLLLLFSPLLSLLPVIIIILETRERQFLSNERDDPAESPEELQEFLPKAAGEVLGALLAGAGDPASRRRLLPNTRAGSDRVLQSCHRAPRRDSTTFTWMCFLCVLSDIYVLLQVLPYLFNL